MQEIKKISVHYLTREEEESIKANIPWEKIDRGIRELVMRFNKLDGIATLQSCAGHVTPIDNDCFRVASASICLRVSEERYDEILKLAPMCGIRNVKLRYFTDGTFWIALKWEPSEYGVAYDLARRLQR